MTAQPAHRCFSCSFPTAFLTRPNHRHVTQIEFSTSGLNWTNHVEMPASVFSKYLPDCSTPDFMCDCDRPEIE